MQQVRDLMQEVFTCSMSTGQMSCQLGAKCNTEPSPTLEVLLLFGCGRQGAGRTEGNPGEPCRASCSLFRPGALHLRCCLHPERWHGLWSDTLSPHSRAIRHCFAWPHESRSSKGGCTLLEPGNLSPNKPPVLQEPALLPPQVTISHIARAHFSMISTCEVGAAP